MRSGNLVGKGYLILSISGRGEDTAEPSLLGQAMLAGYQNAAEASKEGSEFQLVVSFPLSSTFQ